MVAVIEIVINGILMERVFSDAAPKYMTRRFMDRKFVHMRGNKGNEFYVSNWLLFPLYLEDSTEATLLPEATTVLRLVDAKDCFYTVDNFIDALESASPSHITRAVMLHRQWDAYGEQMEQSLPFERLVDILKIPKQKEEIFSLKRYVDNIVAKKK